MKKNVGMGEKIKPVVWEIYRFWKQANRITR